MMLFCDLFIKRPRIHNMTDNLLLVLNPKHISALLNKIFCIIFY